MRVPVTVLALLALGTAWAAPALNTYCNARYGYCVSYPASLRPQGEPDAHDGQVFLSADQQTELRVWGNWQLDGSDTLTARLRAETKAQPGRVVTYQRLRPGWFVVSGTLGNRVFYQRTVFDPHQGRFATLRLRYPRAQARAVEPLIGALAQSLSFPR